MKALFVALIVSAVLVLFGPAAAGIAGDNPPGEGSVQIYVAGDNPPGEG